MILKSMSYLDSLGDRFPGRNSNISEIYICVCFYVCSSDTPWMMNTEETFTRLVEELGTMCDSFRVDEILLKYLMYLRILGDTFPGRNSNSCQKYICVRF